MTKTLVVTGAAMSGPDVLLLRRRCALLAPLSLAMPIPAGANGVESASAQAWLHLPIAVSDASRRPFVAQMLKLIGQAARIEWQIQSVPWARLLLMAERGQALAFGVSRSASREQQFEFSQPVFDNHVWMVVRRDQALVYRGLADLGGRTLCVTRGISYGSAFEAAKQSSLFRVEQVDGDLAARTRMLMAGRCDVMLTSHRNPQPWGVEKVLRQESGFAAGIAVLPAPMQVDPVHFVAARGHQLAQALPRLNAAMRAQSEAIKALISSEL
ncbi:transporter substrate-binding domain-containing protein [Paucibacter sp. B2R-40]|uniref:substrate-binding periplasmic protein n=1 Tax=Paucibacter sp. B2R-40 TaxID=2893554 RepID=UPI0021E44E58|nr:transporter substrate-binding domain-containing protein [Paucibacter sp. B2R-40]MCV2357088.1 transporter substrate-binding domain-containing protein [Paucibacter sp. B2R-40]